MTAIPCLCCGEAMTVTRTKSEKPYVRCDECHVQTFVKGGAGVKRFTAKYGSAWQGGAASAAEPSKAEPAAPASKPKPAPRAPAAKPSAVAPATKAPTKTPEPTASTPATKKGGGFGFF